MSTRAFSWPRLHSYNATCKNRAATTVALYCNVLLIQALLPIAFRKTVVLLL
jgi:hypothetical protein